MKIHLEFVLVGQSMRVDYVLVLEIFIFIFEFWLYIGEESLSYGYEETGKIWMKNQFEWYGERYSIGDTITCYAVNWFCFFVNENNFWLFIKRILKVNVEMFYYHFLKMLWILN